ncbi:MAG: FkbM family methyltransferase, partial [Candidatus Methanomethylicaceae archaeon]
LKFLASNRLPEEIIVEGEIIKVRFFEFIISFPIKMLPYISLNEKFLEEAYDVDVRGAIVLDIGAYIGDSPLYWLHKGASKVIAVEPVPEYYRLLSENCKSLPVIPILGSIGSKVPKLDIVGQQDYGLISCEEFKEYLDTPLLNFVELIKTYRPNVVKLNCEGCEHYLKNELLLIPMLGVQKLILQIHKIRNSYDDLLQILEQKFGKGRITKVETRHFTVIWEITK